MIAGILQANNPFFIIIAGLLIGLVHAFEPDHISAISTQLIKNNNTNNSKKSYLRNLTVISSLKGAFWGAGHTSSIILIGLLIAGLSLNISDNFFISAEILVGLMLIVLGVFTFTNKSILLKRKHIHPHQHSDISHTHSHKHDDKTHIHGHKAYLIGAIHGIAGSGSLVAIAAATISGFDMMIYFLILFGVGSIIGMTVASGVLGLPFILFSKISWVTKYLRYAVAVVALVIGTNIILEIGLSNKLFL